MESITLRDCVLVPAVFGVPDCFRFIMACEEYFHLGSWGGYPIIGVEDSSVVRLEMLEIKVESPLWISVLKVISYCTVVLPLIIGIIVLIARTCYTYRISLKGIEVPPQQTTQDVNQILQGLYLGNGYSCLDCTSLTNIATVNPLQFQHVISMCPMSELRDRANRGLRTDRWGSYPFDGGIEWIYAGRNISGTLEGVGMSIEQSRRKKWAVLVHDTTFPDSDLSQRAPNKEREEIEINEKETRIVAQDPTKWFKPAFEILDKAVNQGKKVLVHCDEGRSRSATLIAAYLINRFLITAEQAEAFIKRGCPRASIQFMPELRQYEQQLRQKRAVRSV